MNASLSILQKLKNQFLKSIANKADFHVAFAPFAFTLTNEDFFFLKNDISSGSDARKYLKEQSEFAYMANSILKKPYIWTMDSDNLLYTAYKNILQSAETIDPDMLTAEEQVSIDKAKAVLFKDDETDSVKYQKYKECALKVSDIDKKIIECTAKKNAIPATNKSEIDLLNIDLTNLQNTKKALLIEWQTKGSKSAIESAKKTYDTIIFSKVNFIEKWNDARDIKISPPNALTDEYGVEFLTTTCIPNSICNYQAPIWKKISILKQEIATLTQQCVQEIPSEVLAEFGNVEIELDAINFEYCIIDILRPWFDESVLNNKNWKFSDDSMMLSEGDDSMRGEIPAYPVKIILSKNIELVYTAGSQKNEDVSNKLKNGDRVFFGPLLLKTIPVNLQGNKLGSYRVQQLSTNQLSVIAKVAIQNTNATPKINDGSRYKIVELISKEPQAAMKRNVEVRSVNRINETKPTPQKIAPVAAAPMLVNTTMISGVGRRTPMSIRAMPIDISTDIPAPPPTPAISTLNGKVVDEHNQPVELAEIQLMNTNNACTQSFLSVSDGSYGFQNIENGKYNVSVKKTGFIINEKIIEINNNINQDFLLYHQPVLTESFQVMAVICKKLPRLPNPVSGAHYI